MANSNTGQGYDFNQDVNTSTGWANFFLNFLSAGMFNYFNGIQQEDNYNLSERSAEAAFQRSLYAWRLNNEYNSPTNQMARLKAAGLNPHLVSNGISNTSSTPQILPGKTFSMLPQQDFIGNFLRTAEIMSDLHIKREDAELRKQQADDDHQIKQAQAQNILQDTILKQIGVKKGNYEFSNFYPQMNAKYQQEVAKLGNENFLLTLQSQRQKMENDIRSYWKKNYMMSDFEFDNMMKEYTAKTQKYKYYGFLPIEKELLGYNRDIRKKEFDYLGAYGTTSPGSGNVFGIPVSALFSPELGQQALETGKALATSVVNFFKGLSGDSSAYTNFGGSMKDAFDKFLEKYLYGKNGKKKGPAYSVGGKW